MNIRLCFACAVRVLTAAVERKVDILDPEKLWVFISDQAVTGEVIIKEQKLFPGIQERTVIPLKDQAYCAFHLAVDKRRKDALPPYSPPPVIGGFNA